MKVEVDKGACISCGLCVNSAGEVFSWDDNEKAKAISGDVPSDLEADVTAAVEGCPTDAIMEK
ncbi:ferredoxin [Halobacteroides halobius DSM 5150]|uniref:Ferredoxin n=1 Tax=Halobacteroides halobius (strain ATCC 35273 / DSM 5150 / MD-1) TaxID=748449 RepID=L0K7M0_HALHC|nr:ferredoxin [Halobacteroides halobius]AGB40334.1 ferredoxin [Halobacteroides halobius DSM 5150]